MSPVTGKVALVTGAASGNGRAIADRLLRDGWTVAANDLDGAALAATAAEAWPRMPVSTHAADVKEAGDVERLAAEVLARHGRVDLLVNNAGITGGPAATTVHETPIAEFDLVLAVNLRGPFLLSRALLPGMLERGSGVIVNVASVAGLVAFPGRAAYNASKGALVQLTRSIAVDCAARGIRCNAICPGMIDTPMTRWRLEQPALRAQVLSRIPQDRIGSPGDVAAAVAFLASDEAGYFNGAALVMDGAYTAL
jgi:NAD(P)-dependent dehydrogenase (short-subunit alcohol dehydrogenase family)